MNTEACVPPKDNLDPLIGASRPRSRHAHWLRAKDRSQLFLVNGSRLFDVDAQLIDDLEAASETGDESVERLLADLGLLLPSLISDAPLVSPPLHAISLAVAQKCNLGCAYCYAHQGDFGGAPKDMAWETARRSVTMLIESAKPGARVNVAFMGGEPLINRPVVRAATNYAARLGAERGVEVGFSITTNGTLLNDEDGEFFEHHGFAVTISLDGLKQQHDRQRPFKHGGGSFDRIIERVRPLLARQQRMQVSARATVAPGASGLREMLDYFLDLKFHSVGFSPVLRAPMGTGEMSARQLCGLLEEMIECGIQFEHRLLRGERYGFANIVNALRELHRGTHRPYPCGAGAGYLGVSAEGDLSACHRFVGDAIGGMGTVDRGINRAAQNRWLAVRHVHAQSPCGTCWARYLCSGGCHHEVIARGRLACDYIRGWLHYCIGAYGRLARLRPDWFAPLPK
jgi:uncharacterized protein